MNKESPTISTQIFPPQRRFNDTPSGMDVLSREELTRLRDISQGGLHETLRRCALAVLTTGTESDDPRAAQVRYPDFDIEVLQLDRGIRLDLKNAPATAFVDGILIRGVADLLFTVVRDIAYTSSEIRTSGKFNLETNAGITSAVFEILRNASVLHPNTDPNLVVCWGGHSIGRDEYMYTKKVGYELGLRALDICTGCGPVNTSGMQISLLSGCSSRPSRYKISSAVPTPPGKAMMPCPSRTKASSRFSMSGMMTSSLTIGFGDSAAMMPGSVMPM